MVNPHENTEMLEYRLVVVEPKAQTILVIAEHLDKRLPTVPIPFYTRAAAALQQACLCRWGLEVFVISFLPRSGTDSLPVAVLEFLSENANTALSAVDYARVDELGLSSEETVALAHTLRNEDVTSISHIGWIHEAIAWVESATHTRLAPKSGIAQLNAGIGFALVRFTMSDGRRWWLKATGAPNAHELAITSLLAADARSSPYLPHLQAVRKDWNAGLMDGSGISLSDMAVRDEDSGEILEEIVRSFASLQISTLDKIDQLLELGAFSQSFDRMIQGAKELFDYLMFAMSQQVSTKAPRIDQRRLSELCGFYQQACERLQELDLPQSLVHGDLNRGNILEARGFVFIDWSESYIACPLISLQHLMLLNDTANETQRWSINQKLRATYLAAWSEVCDPKTLALAMPYLGFLGAASTLYGRGDSLQSPGRTMPERLACARTLTRHIDRAQKILNGETSACF